MKKQTSVEWLIQQWPILESQLPPWLIEQAKAMEKAQIIDAVYYTCSAMSHSDLSCGEEYYQRTFKSE